MTVSRTTPAPPASPPPSRTFDVERVRADFPILARQIHGRPLIYLDNAATTQKPRAVLDAIDRYYTTHNANVHRGVHTLSQEATEAYEGARATVAHFLHAPDARNIVFTRGATEAINLVAQTYGRTHVRARDQILITHMEHHSNIVPWQMLAAQTGAELVVAPIDDRGELIVEAFAKLVTTRTRLAAFTHVSNALGTVNPVRELAALVHDVGAAVLVDGAQAIAHKPIDVAALDCDFYVFSGHKAYGPTGIGALYGRGELLEAMPPWQGGGDMIKSVSFAGTTYNDVPHRFEAGTPDIAGAIGLAAALDYLQALGLEAVAAHESCLLGHAADVLRDVPGLRLVGEPRHRTGAISFTLGDVHPHDVGTVLDRLGIAVRAGHHCAQPVMDRFGLPATVRASVAAYNTVGEIDALAAGLRRVAEMFKA
ncbi:MAG: cysteine desulfurase [Planctomycetota bacterium]|nr:cysteine desulfurase [Planctomycetota bacterium]